MHAITLVVIGFCLMWIFCRTWRLSKETGDLWEFLGKNEREYSALLNGIANIVKMEHRVKALEKEARK